MIKSAVAVVTAMTSFSFLPTTTTQAEVPQPILVETAMPTPPLLSLPRDVQARFACVAYRESRGKVVDTNVVSSAQGMFQFMPDIWQFARQNIKGLPPTPNEADIYQQQSAVVFYYNRNHGLYPEWTDGC